jgi:hypothetical protein
LPQRPKAKRLKAGSTNRKQFVSVSRMPTLH